MEPVYKISCLCLILSVCISVCSAGHWGTWTEFTPCSVTCGDGALSREAMWILDEGDPPQVSDNPLKMTDRYGCYKGECPVDGKWTGWGSYAACTKACGGGKRKRFRRCENPSPSGSGKPCKGLNWEEEECNKVSCPPTPIGFDMRICNESYFKCDSGNMCILIDGHCNKVIQCDDGSDEMDCAKVLRVQNGGVRYSLSGNGVTKNDGVSIFLGFVFLMSLMLILH